MEHAAQCPALNVDSLERQALGKEVTQGHPTGWKRVRQTEFNQFGLINHGITSNSILTISELIHNLKPDYEFPFGLG